MAAGRKPTGLTSAGFTPAMLKTADSEKNAMPNDMANRGWRTVPQTGSTRPAIDACSRSSHDVSGRVDGARCRKWLVAIHVVDGRIFSTRTARGSTAASDVSLLRSAAASDKI